MIYHIATQADWTSAQTRGLYSAASLQNEGFIHCSTASQALHVANAFYRGRSDLLLLRVDEGKLASELKWEPPAGSSAPGIDPADSFPHIYGAINLDAVTDVQAFLPGEDGRFAAL